MYRVIYLGLNMEYWFGLFWWNWWVGTSM